MSREPTSSRVESRPVTERDLRMPEFRDVSPEELEFRADGCIVRRDRWQRGIQRMVDILSEYNPKVNTRQFEIPEALALLEDLLEHLIVTTDARDVSRILGAMPARAYERKFNAFLMQSNRPSKGESRSEDLQSFAEHIWQTVFDDMDRAELRARAVEAGVRDRQAQREAVDKAIVEHLRARMIVKQIAPASA